MFVLEWFLHKFQYFKQYVSHNILFRMVFTLISKFYARRVRQCLVFNGFRTNFSILSKTCDREFRFGMVITLSSVFKARRERQTLV